MKRKIPNLVAQSNIPHHKSPSYVLEPTQENLEAVRPGDHIKLRSNSNPHEVFWAYVTRVDRSRQDNAMVFDATVTQNMVYTGLHGLKHKDKLEVGFQYVLCILKEGQ